MVLKERALQSNRDGTQSYRDQPEEKYPMKINRWLASLAVTLPLAIGAQRASAQAAPDIDIDKLPKVNCTSLTFSHDFLDQYPKAPAACQEARIYQGKKYAKFSGKVYLTDPAFITIQVFNVRGDPLDTISFKGNPDAVLYVNGQREHFSELKVGDPVTFWISENRFSLFAAPGMAEGQGVAKH
jgi:hypothetical protein